MNRFNRTHLVALALGGLLAQAALLSQSAVAAGRPCSAFSELRITLEQNATDGDTEVVLFAKGQDDGLKSLHIFNPKRRFVGVFAGGSSGIGIREFNLESAEPPDVNKVLASFPQGNYSFIGRTVKGDCLKGTAALSHQIAPPTVLLSPLEEQVVPINQVVLSWAIVANAERYIVELNNEDTGSEFSFEVFPPATSITIPAEFLQAGSEYQFAVGVKIPDGNKTFVERSFFIAP